MGECLLFTIAMLSKRKYAFDDKYLLLKRNVDKFYRMFLSTKVLKREFATKKNF